MTTETATPKATPKQTAKQKAAIKAKAETGLVASFEKDWIALGIDGFDVLPTGKAFARFIKATMIGVYKARRETPNARQLSVAGNLCAGMQLLERLHITLAGGGIARTLHASFTYTPAKAEKQTKIGSNRHIDYWCDLLFQRTPTLSETLDPERMVIHTD